MSTKQDIVKRLKTAQDRLVLQAADLSLETIAGMVKNKAIDVAPLYQRRERWTPEKQSALIESFLLNIPVPPIYLSEEDFGVYSAIDGKQRITAISAFMSDGLRLQRLETFKEIEDARFSDLPPDLQNSLRVRPYLRAITLLKQSAPELKYEVFTRLNRQGVPLNPQEIRNVIYRGPLNDLIYDLSKNAILKKKLKIKDSKSTAYRDMDDAEYVLRFLTLHEDLDHFQESFRRSMDQFMASRQHAQPQYLSRLRVLFNRTIDGCEKIWGDHAFKRVAGNLWRDQFLGGMYDAEMLAVATLSDAALKDAISHRAKIVTATKQLFESDPQFERAVREGTNTRARVSYRVEKISELLESV